MKILQLMPRVAFPSDDGGRISMANVTRHLLDCGDEVFVLTYDELAPSQSTIALGNHSVRQNAVQHSTQNTPLRILRSLFDTEPIYLRKHYTNQAVEIASDVIRRHEIDIIHADHTAMGPLALRLKQIHSLPVGLRLHNIEWKIWQRAADELSFWNPKRWYLQSQARRLQAREAECIRDVDVAFAISNVDRNEALTMSPGSNVVTVSAGVNSDEWAIPTNNIRAEHEIVMTAAWSWTHNVQGALWFLRKVLPIVRLKIPDATVVIPGKNIPAEFSQFRPDGVNVIGYQKSIQPVYHHGALFVVPLFVGSGVRIKILEAMAAGMPVIATTIGAEGIDADQSVGLFRVDTVLRQALLIIDLMSDAEKRERLGAAAREFVTVHHSWRHEIEKIHVAYSELLSGSSTMPDRESS